MNNNRVAFKVTLLRQSNLLFNIAITTAFESKGSYLAKIK
jgi:hypothetical protein